MEALALRCRSAAGAISSATRALRQAARRLLRVPGLTATIVLTLALAIGANATVFSALSAVLLEPLPYPEADRLVYVTQTMRGGAVDNVGPVRLEDWNERAETFDGLTGYYTEDVSDTSGDLPQRLRAASVAPRFFDVWQIPPALGRAFVDDDHEAGAAPVAVISSRYWARRFDSDPQVIGATIRFGEDSFVVVGVMPADFAFADPDVDIWVPVVYYDFVLNRRNAWYAGYGRLREGVTIEQAQADLARAQFQLAGEFPDTDRDIGVIIESLKARTVGTVRASLWLLFGAVTVLLLIACTNIASLLLARASQRQQDVSVRLALGSSRISIAMLILTEAAVLVFVGSLIGLIAAFGATLAFRRMASGLPRADEIAIDGGALVYTLATIVVVTLLCGLVPAFRAARQAAGGRPAASGRWQVSSRHSAQWLLVGVQVALSVMLLGGAGLLLRSFQELSRVDPGFEPRNVLTFRMSGSYGEQIDIAELVEQLLPEIAALPGIVAAAASTPVPGVLNDRSGFDIGTAEFRISGSEEDPGNMMLSEMRFVSSSYFDVMQIPLLLGEPCRRRPSDETQDLVVNLSFASRYFGTRSPVGQMLESGDGSVGRVVAVYGDARELGTERSPVPTAYRCRAAIAYPPLSFIVRTRDDPSSVIDGLRQRFKELEPARSLYDFMTLEERMGAEYMADRMRTMLITVFAAAALALVCLGIYGTLSYVVSLRQREVGVRVALGARDGNIVGQFLLKAMRVVGISAAAGLAGTALSSRAVAGMLFGVSRSDPFTLGTVIGIILLVALGAALLPALHASRIDPMIALRQD